MKIYIIIITLSLLFFSCQDSNKKEASNSNLDSNLSPELIKSISRGKDVYNNFCVTCHMANGNGFSKTFPPLANSDYLMNKRVESIRVIKYGSSEEIIVNGETYTTPMARLGLSDKEVADVMNYITNGWGNNNPDQITEKEVSKIQP